MELLAGRSSHLNKKESIYDAMMEHRRFPDTLFTGSLARKHELRKAIADTPAVQ